MDERFPHILSATGDLALRVSRPLIDVVDSSSGENRLSHSVLVWYLKLLLSFHERLSSLGPLRSNLFSSSSESISVVLL